MHLFDLQDLVREGCWLFSTIENRSAASTYYFFVLACAWAGGRVQQRPGLMLLVFVHNLRRRHQSKALLVMLIMQCGGLGWGEKRALLAWCAEMNVSIAGWQHTPGNVCSCSQPAVEAEPTQVQASCLIRGSRLHRHTCTPR